MTTVSCPHQDPKIRQCTGCTKQLDIDIPGIYYCEGEVTARVYRDSEGDSGVINGINHFWAVEDEVADCGCQLTEEEIEAVSERLVQAGQDDDGYADMLEDESRDHGMP